MIAKLHRCALNVTSINWNVYLYEITENISCAQDIYVARDTNIHSYFMMIIIANVTFTLFCLYLTISLDYLL